MADTYPGAGIEALTDSLPRQARQAGDVWTCADEALSRNLTADALFFEAKENGTLSEKERLDIGAEYAHHRQQAIGLALQGSRPWDGPRV